MIDRTRMQRKTRFQTKNQILSHKHNIKQVKTKILNSKAKTTINLKIDITENPQIQRIVEHTLLRSHFRKGRVVYDTICIIVPLTLR